MVRQPEICPRYKTMVTRWPRPRHKTLNAEEPQPPVLLPLNNKFPAIRLFKHRAKEEMIMTLHPIGHTAPLPHLMAMTQFEQNSTKIWAVDKSALATRISFTTPGMLLPTYHMTGKVVTMSSYQLV